MYLFNAGVFNPVSGGESTCRLQFHVSSRTPEPADGALGVCRKIQVRLVLKTALTARLWSLLQPLFLLQVPAKLRRRSVAHEVLRLKSSLYLFEAGVFKALA